MKTTYVIFQLEGEGIRYEIVSFVKSIQRGKAYDYVDDQISEAIVQIFRDFSNHKYIII